MQEDSPRETFVMRRGDYESPTEQVNAATPKVLTVGKPTVKAGNRLDLAHWLTSRENPLTARVTVNQWWSEIFGRGLVSTPEDFGSQGEYPSHPELLDWLASELIESGWSMKHLHKLMVMSFAFRQSNAQLADSAQQDPQNRWLSRGPRFRMKAELIRDNALAISGLLSTKQGGPPSCLTNLTTSGEVLEETNPNGLHRPVKIASDVVSMLFGNVLLRTRAS